jgi:hypothetical protein
LRWQNGLFEAANTLHSKERKPLFHHHNTGGTDEYRVIFLSVVIRRIRVIRVLFS